MPTEIESIGVYMDHRVLQVRVELFGAYDTKMHYIARNAQEYLAVNRQMNMLRKV